MEIEATDIKMSTSVQTETFYFTGGLCAHPLNDGHLALAPVGVNDKGLIGYRLTWPEVLEATTAAGCVMAGVNQRHNTGRPTRSEVWRPDVPTSGQQLHAGDSWRALSHVARVSGDQQFSDLARYVSVSVHAAGVRLRDVADAHHEQLRWALIEGKKPGVRFSNTAMTDLHLAFHSLAGELYSARDHLAHVAAVECSAPEKVDGMGRLEEWLATSDNAAAANNPLVALLFANMGTKNAPGWLRILGEFRNTVMHRQPMGANPAAGGLSVAESMTCAGPVRTIRLVPMNAATKGPDPFVELVGLYKQFEALAIEATARLPYKVELPRVVGR
ncbi:hypothetical protein [Metallibacterium scheffleri]|uniref:Uncharacterized protein n=1 Tax=Metallibacterium scheffleri TaxID=993689 RepID=A0A4S3KEY1_9GAMM|nr:hypothetical protein [Metallibacterium scheffleri]THD07125.1 hypothetical protein B1806_15355 [Metallibacterium scheffleri]